MASMTENTDRLPLTASAYKALLNKALANAGISPTVLSNVAAAATAIPTGCLTLDLNLGGGVACGRWFTAYGASMAGKSTLLGMIVGQAQRLKVPIIVVADHEGSLDPGYWERGLGVDMSRICTVKYDKSLGTYQIDKWEPGAIILLQNDTGDETYRFLDQLSKHLPSVDEGIVQAVFMIDSINAMSPEASHYAELGPMQQKMAKPTMHAKWLPRFKSGMRKRGITVIASNQLISNPTNQFVPEQEPGGQAVRFFPDQKLFMKGQGRSQRWEETRPSGHRVLMTTKCRVDKNKIYRPYLECEIPIAYGFGFDQTYDFYYYMLATKQLVTLEKKVGNSTSHTYEITWRQPSISDDFESEPKAEGKTIEIPSWDDFCNYVTPETIAKARAQISTTFAFRLYTTEAQKPTCKGCRHLESCMKTVKDKKTNTMWSTGEDSERCAHFDQVQLQGGVTHVVGAEDDVEDAAVDVAAENVVDADQNQRLGEAPQDYDE